jgi:hypothetical protein
MFERSEDTLGEYSKGSIIYSLPISEKKYLVFNHYNSKRKIELQGFDLWISEYSSNNEIGKRKAVSIKSLVLSFDLENNKDVIEEHLPKN